MNKCKLCGGPCRKVFCCQQHNNLWLSTPEAKEQQRKASHASHASWEAKKSPPPPPRLCECKCGQYAGARSRFIRGHNMKTPEGRAKMRLFYMEHPEIAAANWTPERRALASERMRRTRREHPETFVRN